METVLAATPSYRDEVLAAFDAVGTEQLEVARHLGWSVRTLQRRLFASGTNYQALVNEHRRRTALALMKDPSLTLVQIAHKCGFSEARSFQRALRRWRKEATSTGERLA
jgi:AraC-like DNA-binding protein